MVKFLVCLIAAISAKFIYIALVWKACHGVIDGTRGIELRDIFMAITIGFGTILYYGVFIGAYIAYELRTSNALSNVKESLRQIIDRMKEMKGGQQGLP